MNFLDKIALSISPKWGASRLKYRAFANAIGGYVTPYSNKKSMNGLRSIGLKSPKADISDKLDGIRALSRDVYMTSALGAAIIKRHKTQTICSGLKFQSTPDRSILGMTTDQARDFGKNYERYFDLWAESTFCDIKGNLNFGQLQGLVYLSLLMNGDFFWMPIWRKPKNPEFPFELTVRIIDADLVRNPYNVPLDRMQNGVETDDNGEVVAYHVWNNYSDGTDSTGSIAKKIYSTRIPVYTEHGRKQIYHVFNPERFDQSRGLPALSNVAETLKQLTRLNEATVMGQLVSSFFTVFVKDATNLGGAINPAYTSIDRYNENQTDPDSFDQDLEMGYGNIAYIGGGKDISIANPNKTDADYHQFFDNQAIQACGGANMPYEQAVMHYTSSYTAARAADNAVWKHRIEDRAIISSGFCTPLSEELLLESVLKQYISAPKYFTSYLNKKSYSKGYWVGVGRGYVDPWKEIKASVEGVKNKLSTREDEYTTLFGGRWDSMIERYADEEKRINELLGEQTLPQQKQFTEQSQTEEETNVD
jgi:lambda family phage portal protein